jgi:hypothetical protein
VVAPFGFAVTFLGRDDAVAVTVTGDVDTAHPLLEGEMARIALRRRFEEMGATEDTAATTGAQPMVARGRPPTPRAASGLHLPAGLGQGCPVGSGGIPRLFRQGVWYDR